MTLPLITIGITCFNAEKSISRSIESAQKQNWQNIEIIIVDDSSTDCSVEIINSYQKEDSRITLIRQQENLGYPSALNQIISKAKGDYIAFFDDDDDNSPNRLTEQYKRLQSFNDKVKQNFPVLCYTDRKVFIDGQEKPEAYVNAIGRKAVEPNGKSIADYILWHKKEAGFQWGEFGSCTLMAKTKTLRHYHFDTKFRRCAEWDLAIRASLDGGYFIAVDKPLVIQHKTNTTDKKGSKPLIYNLLLRKKYKAYLKKQKTYLGSLCQAYTRFYYFRNRKLLSRFFLILSCLLSYKILKEEIKNQI